MCSHLLLTKEWFTSHRGILQKKCVYTQGMELNGYMIVSCTIVHSKCIYPQYIPKSRAAAAYLSPMPPALFRAQDATTISKTRSPSGCWVCTYFWPKMGSQRAKNISKSCRFSQRERISFSSRDLSTKIGMDMDGWCFSYLGRGDSSFYLFLLSRS